MTDWKIGNQIVCRVQDIKQWVAFLVLRPPPPRQIRLSGRTGFYFISTRTDGQVLDRG